MVEEPSSEAELTADAVFEQASALPPEPPDPGPTLHPPPIADPIVGVPIAKPTAKSPLRDYLRELKQEFEEQEDEGKL